MLVFFSSTTDVLIPTYFLRMNASEGERMWSKRASELADMGRISELNWSTPLSGCWEAPIDFSSLVAQNYQSDQNISIVPALDLEIMLYGLTR